MRKLRYFFGGALFPCALLALLWALFILFLALRIPAALAPAALIERLFSVAAAFWELSSRDPGESKISKLILILLLPWTGGVLAFVWRRKPAPFTPTETLSKDQSLISRVALLSGETRNFAQEAEYFDAGRAMYERLLYDLEHAKTLIYLQYYIVARGTFLNDVLDILTHKAQAGVSVYLIADGFGSALTLPPNFEKEMKKRGIQVKTARPVKLPLRDLNRRDHRKIAVIDDVLYVGGVNLADEYIGEKIRFGYWKDTALRVTGAPAYAFMKRQATEFGISLPPLPKAETENGVPCAIVCDGARDSLFRAGGAALGLTLLNAKRYAYFCTPYLAPDTALFTAFRQAAASGTDVRILIPHIPDKKSAFLLTRHYARELMKAGVKVREYTAGFLHAKSVAADGVYSFVSSYNLDFRSLYLQAECGVLVENNALCAHLTQDFLTDWESSLPVKKEGFFARIGRAFLQFLLPLM